MATLFCITIEESLLTTNHNDNGEKEKLQLSFELQNSQEISNILKRSLPCCRRISRYSYDSHPDQPQPCKQCHRFRVLG